MADAPPPAREPRVDSVTAMAAERTMLAWVRTGLALMGFGFVVARFGLFLRKLSEWRGLPLKVPPHQSMSLWSGVALVLLGVAVNIIAAIRFTHTIHQLRRGQPAPAIGGRAAVIVALFMAAIGVAIAVYLMRLA